jgi:hypothetical protein
MLVFASKVDSGDEDLRRVIAGISGVSIHRFHFPGPGMYDPGALKLMKRDYQAAGWKQLVNNHEKGHFGIPKIHGGVMIPNKPHS